MERITESRGADELGSVEDVQCRPAGVEDFSFLATMLGEAAVWRPDKLTPTADEVMADPRYAMYLTGWLSPPVRGVGVTTDRGSLTAQQLPEAYPTWSRFWEQVEKERAGS